MDIAIGLVYAALQWPDEFEQAAIDWLVKMECEMNAEYDGEWVYGSVGDTDGKDSIDNA